MADHHPDLDAWAAGLDARIVCILAELTPEEREEMAAALARIKERVMAEIGERGD